MREAQADADDIFLRGMASVHQWTRAANDEALRSFYKAIELDHGLPRPRVGLFGSWVLGFGQRTCFQNAW